MRQRAAGISAVIGLGILLAGCNSNSQSASTASAGSVGALAIHARPATQIAAGSAYSMQVQVSSPAGETVGYSIHNKPLWAVFDPSTGALQGVPGASDIGTYPGIVVTASSGTATASLPPFSIRVVPASTPTSTGSGSTSGSTSTSGGSAGAATSTGSGSTSSSSSTSSTGTTATGTGSAASTAQRPSYNNGNGFFVLNGNLYDPNGNLFRIRGVNRLHWDSNSAAGIAQSGANAVRWDMDFTRDAGTNVSEIQTQGISDHSVPIVGNWTTTCSTDPATLNGAVQSWVSQASQWKQLNEYLILDVANEWGPSDSTVWRDSYISAIASLRAAGYTGPILVDSGGCGQDDQDLLQYSQAVFNSDPEKNVMFAVHMYGSANDYSAPIQSVHKGNPTVITLASTSSTHPFSPGYNGTNNSYSGINAYEVSGAQGMTQLNGEHSAPTNVGGSPGAWTITLNVDSTNWPDYTGGGTVVDYNGNYALRIARLAALAQQTGAVYIIGEFGPGQNIGPSPTMVTPGQIITAAESNGIGWLAWAWDDNNLPNCQADNTWFSMTYSCGQYVQASDLTTYGQDVVLNPAHGIRALAKPATIF